MHHESKRAWRNPAHRHTWRWLPRRAPLAHWLVALAARAKSLAQATTLPPRAQPDGASPSGAHLAPVPPVRRPITAPNPCGAFARCGGATACCFAGRSASYRLSSSGSLRAGAERSAHGAEARAAAGALSA
eukprot:7214406-Prymnesium_polylepis.2